MRERVTYTDWSVAPDEQLIRIIAPTVYPPGARSGVCACTDTRLCASHAAMIREGLDSMRPSRRLFGFGGPW